MSTNHDDHVGKSASGRPTTPRLELPPRETAPRTQPPHSPADGVTNEPGPGECRSVTPTARREDLIDVPLRTFEDVWYRGKTHWSVLAFKDVGRLLVYETRLVYVGGSRTIVMTDVRKITRGRMGIDFI